LTEQGVTEMNVVVTRQRWTQSVAWLALCGAGSALIYLLVFFLPHQLTQYVSVPLIPFYGMANANAAVYAFGWVLFSRSTTLATGSVRGARRGRSWRCWPAFLCCSR